MAAHGEALRQTRLRKCVSAGEALPAATRALWKEATGIELIDGIGATELLHIFISHDEANARPGATGKAGARLPGQGGGRRRARKCRPAPWASSWCKARPAAATSTTRARKTTCKDGWNLTGDAYLMDADGYFHLPGPARRHDHFGRLQHRRARGGRRPAGRTRRWPNAP